ncbi:PstS family phosphate ABC transporter substrate-binding protein [Hymenobacter rubripertinctus]|uniref:Phosphate ABC transporter substrate-binding protein, PhoT family n=1 Tax=Hymenobacter rubripertinctus TaxID=2029981 RepID=A0A418R5Z2_9BACT|nr:substrate-binding domain-containing protein [Hymenobacter rubripertinctus]RIY12774.1 phosphate ABC transporter substrate-binding protein, PhoT family [Hymenobacter rubripertinctus]
MMHANFKVMASLLLMALGLLGCNSGDNNGRGQAIDTPTSGTVRIGVDETFEPILKSQVDTFQKLYPAAHLQTVFQPERDIIQALLTDSIRLAVVSRPLTTQEQNHFKRLKIEPKAIRIGVDGVAIILHPSNPDSLLTTAQLRAIFTGQLTQWGQLSPKNTLGEITAVFDNNNSSTARFVQDSITRGTALAKGIFASKSNPALLDYVATHPNAIGVIGVNWISDRDDAAVQKFLKRVRIAGISSKTSGATADDYFQPYQAYLAQKTYPLRRELYVVSREARAGLGTGFASFVAGNKGQLIMLKSGLMPATGQVRLIEVKPD